MSSIEVRQLSAFGRQIEMGISRNLHLLKAISNVHERADDAVLVFRQVNVSAEKLIERIQEQGLAEGEADYSLVEVMEKGRDSMASLYENIERELLCAVASPEVREEDGIAEVCAVLLKEIGDAHDNLNALAWVIGETLVENEATLPRKFTSADELFDVLGA